MLLVYFNLTVSIGDSELDWIVPWDAPKYDPVSEEEEKKLGCIKSAIKFLISNKIKKLLSSVYSVAISSKISPVLIELT